MRRVIPRHAFYHAYLVNDWERLVAEQIQTLQVAGIETLDLSAFVVTPDPRAVGRFYELMDAAWGGPWVMHSQSLGNEVDALNWMLGRIAYYKHDPEHEALLYFHTKGITRPNDPCVRDWRLMMEHFTIVEWWKAIDKLSEGYDAVGVNLLKDHFSGNFWWATLAHLQRLQPIASNDRNLAEGWVTGRLSGMQGLKLGSLHESHVDHYHERYPFEFYGLRGQHAP